MAAAAAAATSVAASGVAALVPSDVTVVKQWRMHDGVVLVLQHASRATGTPMTFSLYLPPAAVAGGGGRVPVIMFLSGLTCSWENFTTKAGAQRYAAEAGVALVAPDTSPRGAGIEGEAAAWDFGVGAGFYVDATQAPWSAAYRMASYINDELPALLARVPCLNCDAVSIMGHSMGGLGALTSALSHPGRYRAVTAFAPICHPSACPWGRKAFTGYLGAAGPQWAAYDPTHLVASYAGPPLHLVIEQGGDDEFLAKGELAPADFLAAAAAAGVPVDYRLRPGYDHSYYTIATFIGAEIARHAALLSS